MLSDLSFLRAEGFVDAPKPDADLGLEEPAFALSLSGEGLDLEFALGEERAGRRVARGAGDALFVVAKERIEDFPRELVAWRDKSLARFEPADAGRLEIAFVGPESAAGDETVMVVRGSGGWQDEAGSLSSQRVAELVAELARLAAVDIVAESLGERELAGLGLLPPRVRLRVFGADTGPSSADPLCDVSLGLGDPERGVFAQRVGSPQVFRIAAELAEQLPLSRAGWAAGFGAASDDTDEPGEGDDEAEGAEPLP
jgi:hypothetical protein